MKNIIKILNQIASTSSTKQKEQILKENQSNELLKQVLYYTYNPYLKYKLTEKTIKPSSESMVEDDSVYSIFTVLDILAKSNINDVLRANVNGFLGNIKDEDERQLYINMILKDLKIKCNTKTINKVWSNLIPSFSIMLAEKYWDFQDRVVGKSFTLTMKMDGNRIIAIKERGEVKLFTRQGQEYEGLVEIEQLLKNCKFDKFVLDGELLCSNYKEIDPKDRYKATTKLSRTKGEKKGLTFVAFDIIELQDFKNGECTTPYKKRREALEEMISTINSPLLNIVEKLYQGTDTSKITELLDKVVAKGEEGLMINLDEEPYKLTRTTNILKVKKMLTADVRVIGVYEGEKGKEFEGTLGGVTIEFIHNEQIHTCNCGSGFKVHERKEFWENPSLIVGKIIELNYFEVSQNDQGGYGLRFPIFKGVRDDKFEISMA